MCKTLGQAASDEMNMVWKCHIHTQTHIYTQPLLKKMTKCKPGRQCKQDASEINSQESSEPVMWGRSRRQGGTCLQGQHWLCSSKCTTDAARTDSGGFVRTKAGLTRRSSSLMLSGHEMWPHYRPPPTGLEAPVGICRNMWNLRIVLGGVLILEGWEWGQGQWIEWKEILLGTGDASVGSWAALAVTSGAVLGKGLPDTFSDMSSQRCMSLVLIY